MFCIKKIILMIIVFGFFGSMSVQAKELSPTKLSVAGTWSQLSQYKQFEYPFWNDEISQKSDGKVTANIKGFNEMGLKGFEVVRLMKLGVIDFGSTVLGYLAADGPQNEGIDLAGISPNIETAKKVSEAYKPVLTKLYEKEYGIKLLGIWPYSAQVIFCNTPITGLADLKGKKVRTSGRSLAEFVTALGGTGVTMAFSEVVIALQKGVVDCAITGSLSGYSAKWHEVSTHLYALPVGWAQVIHAVSLKAWKKIDPSVRNFLEQEITDLEARIWAGAQEDTIQGVNCNTGTGDCAHGMPAGMTLVPVSDSDAQLLEKVLNETVLPKWSARCGQTCTQDWNQSIGKVLGKEI